jgi:hypothetical protein
VLVQELVDFVVIVEYLHLFAEPTEQKPTLIVVVVLVVIVESKREYLHPIVEQYHLVDIYLS